jgi:hypothetical protein
MLVLSTFNAPLLRPRTTIEAGIWSVEVLNSEQ